MNRCPKCGGDLWEDVQTSLRVCEECSWGYTPSGRAICPSCAEGDCDWCVSWRREESCGHECLFQHHYGRPEDIGFITADDW